jgi:hypothetical protein
VDCGSVFHVRGGNTDTTYVVIHGATIYTVYIESYLTSTFDCFMNDVIWLELCCQKICNFPHNPTHTDGFRKHRIVR